MTTTNTVNNGAKRGSSKAIQANPIVSEKAEDSKPKARSTNKSTTSTRTRKVADNKAKDDSTKKVEDTTKAEDNKATNDSTKKVESTKAKNDSTKKVEAKKSDAPKAETKVESKEDDKMIVNVAEIEKTTGRNFYATKPDRKGKDVPYAFERIAERNEWMEKNDDAKPVTALEVYQMLNKSTNDALIANRNHRVLKVKADDEIEVKKGQRLIRC